jgi:DNA polymerase-3 subunit delta'
LLIERDGIDPKMAEFAANAAQGHIGRAKYLATNEEARKTREKILNIPFTVKDLASAFEAANTLVELAKSQALAESEVRDEAELAKLKESYGSTGSKLATGGSKAVKELEKEQKTRASRKVRDFLDASLLDISSLYRDVLTVKIDSKGNLINQDFAELIKSESESISETDAVKAINTILEHRKKLTQNSSPTLTVESLISATGIKL